MDRMDLQSPRDVVSPRLGKQWDSKAPLWLNDSGFAESLDQVKQAGAMARQGHWPDEYLSIGNPSGLAGAKPDLLKEKLSIYGPRACRNLAMSVSMDSYWDLGNFMLEELLKRGYHFKNNKPGTIQFCDKEDSLFAFMVDLHQRCHKSIDRIFDIKYYWQKPRPEDYDKTPGCNFTVDGYGAPGHWSYGAGHAVLASTTERVLHDHIILEGDISKQVTHECFMFAYGRHPLGVHFIEDNLEGWRVGQQF